MERLVRGLPQLVGGLLSDPIIEQREMTSDRVSAAVSINTSTLDQAAVLPRTGFSSVNDFTDHFSSQSFSPQTGFYNPGRLVNLTKATISGSTEQFGTIVSVQIPKIFFSRQSLPAYGPSRYFRYIRTGYYFKLLVNVAAGVSGSVLLWYCPFNVKITVTDPRTYLLLPHALLNLGTTSAAELYVPYVNAVNYTPTDSDELGTVFVSVWTKLLAPAGVSNSVTVQLLGAMRQFDFQNPRPFVSVRDTVVIAEGFAAMNLSTHRITGTVPSLALDYEETQVDSFTAGMTEPITDMLTLLRVPIPIGTHDKVDIGFFAWSNTDAVNTAIIDKTLFGTTLGPVFIAFFNAFEFWRGSLEFNLTVFATPFNKGRLRMCFFPNHETSFTYDQSDNSLNVFMDLGLDSTATLVVPFSSTSWLKTTIHSSPIGRLAIFVTTELQVNINTPNSLNAMLTVNAGADFQLVSPYSRGITYQGPGVLPDEMSAPVEDSGLGSVENRGGSPEVTMKKSSIPNYEISHVKVVDSTHTNVDILYGRAAYIGQITIGTPTTGDMKIKTFDIDLPHVGTFCLLRMIQFFTGKLAFHVYNPSDYPLYIAHDYITFDETISFSTFMNLGALCILPKQFASVQVPYYNSAPVVQLNYTTDLGSKTGLGTLGFYGYKGTVIQLWVNFIEPKFFFPIPMPKQASAMSLVGHRTVSQLMVDYDLALSVVDAFNKNRALEPVLRDSLKMQITPEKVLNEIEELVALYGSNDIEQHVRTNREFLEDFASGYDIANEHAPAKESPFQMALVKKNKGCYDHYGLMVMSDTESFVLHLNSEDMLDSLITGNAVFVREPMNNSWTITESKLVESEMVEVAKNFVGSTIKFSWDNNCETVARFLGSFKGLNQSDVLKVIFGVFIISGAFALGSEHVSLSQMAKNGANSVSDAIFRTYVSFTQVVIGTIEKSIIKTVAKVLIRFGCYAILYCGNPTLASTMSLGTLVLMDVSNLDESNVVKSFVTALFEGDIQLLSEAMADVVAESMEPAEKLEMIQKTVDTANEIAHSHGPLREFNVFSNAGRNLEWWLSKLKAFFMKLKAKLYPDDFDKALEFLDENSEKILTFITEADTVLYDANDTIKLKTLEFQEQLRYYHDRLIRLKNICLKAGATQLVIVLNQLIAKFVNTPKLMPEPNTILRMEPVGIWINGAPGCGKSWFASQLMSLVCEKLGRPLEVYRQGTVSEFWDGYRGQFMHYMDDFGQCRDENEVKTICQVISSQHFPINMANIDLKPIFYTSEMVFVTTNKNDFQTVTLNSEKALKRRFKFQFKIKAKPEYIKNGCFDIAKAQADGTLKTGTCWMCCRNSGSLVDEFEEFSLQAFADELVADYVFKRKVTDDYNLAMNLKKNDSTVSVENVPSTFNDLLVDMYKKKFNVKSVEAAKLQAPGVSALVDSFSEWVDDNDLGLRSLFRVKKPVVSIPLGLRTMFSNTLRSLKTWSSSIKPYYPLILVSLSIVTATSSAVGAYLYMRKTSEVVEDVAQKLVKPVEIDIGAPEKRPYSLDVKNLPRRVAPIATTHNPIFSTGWTHLVRSSVWIEGKDDLWAMGLCETQLVVYTHCLELLSPTDIIHYNGLSCFLGEYDVTLLKDPVSNIDYEVAILTLKKMPFRFKNITHLLSNPQPGKDVIISYGGGTMFRSFNATDVEIVQNLELYPNDVDLSSSRMKLVKGRLVTGTFKYHYASKPGSCGGVVIQKQSSGYKIIGMHIAGWEEICVGYAASMRCIMQELERKAVGHEQGIVKWKEQNVENVYSPTNTRLVPSPFFGLTHDIEKQPAVLHPSDTRLKVSIENMVKASADKWTSNVFNISEDEDDVDYMVWEEACMVTRNKIWNVTGFVDEVSWKEAINGMDNSNPIDMTTSPGLKYTKQGKEKRDLFVFNDGEQCWEMKPEFQRECEELLEALRKGEGRPYFATVLKDELLPNVKIEQGKTRAIESCPVDFVVVYRKIMGRFYDRVYGSNPIATGVAIGINPYQHYHDLFCSLEGFIYNIDYKCFDGTLPAEVMRAGVEIMAELHFQPDLIRKLHEPIVDSVHYVFDEIWGVYGGMPSGAPCTSMLNSICNILMTRCVLRFCGVRQDSIQLITYGDDIIFTTPFEIDADDFVRHMKQSFGMTVTSSDKVSKIRPQTLDEVTFLKRSFSVFPSTSHVVGILDKNVLLQNIQWCRGIDEFKQQVNSWLMELVLHGKEFYDLVTNAVRAAAISQKIYIPTFEQQKAQTFLDIFY